MFGGGLTQSTQNMDVLCVQGTPVHYRAPFVMMEPVVLCVCVCTFSQSKYCLFRNVSFYNVLAKIIVCSSFSPKLSTGVAPDIEEMFPFTIFVPVFFAQSGNLHTAAFLGKRLVQQLDSVVLKGSLNLM